MAKKVGPGQIVGLGLSFGVTMLVSILIMYKVGQWIDGKLGLDGIFAFIGILMGVFSGFRLLLENVQSIDRPRGREYDAWKEAQVKKQQEQEAERQAKKLAEKQKREERKEQKRQQKLSNGKDKK